MFMGEYNHTVDAKGRLIIPSRFREELKNEFIVTKGLDGCLFVFPGNEWQIFEEKLKALPLTNKMHGSSPGFLWRELHHVNWTGRGEFSYRYR